MILEFSHVENPILRQLYDTYSFNVIPRIGGLVANDSESYQYLVESIRRFPVQVKTLRTQNNRSRLVVNKYLIHFNSGSTPYTRQFTHTNCTENWKRTVQLV